MTLVPGDLPKLHVTAPDGAQAEIYLQGGHIATWQTPDGNERLFLSQRADLRPGSATRGGVPVVFPQFSGLGSLSLKHGFARIMTWEHTGTDRHDTSVTAHFELRDTEATRRIWDHAFHLTLAVTIGGPQLRMVFAATNTGDQPFTFTAALHTYLRVDDIDQVVVDGLGSLAYREHGIDGIQHEEHLRISGEIDRIYWQTPGPIILRTGNQAMQVTAEGFADAVVWNPGRAKCAAIVDMEPDGYRSMLCIEAAMIGHPVTLSPDETWTGSQTLSVMRVL